MEQTIRIPYRVVKSMCHIVDFYINDEKKDYMANKKADHIYLEMSVVNEWLDSYSRKKVGKMVRRLSK